MLRKVLFAAVLALLPAAVARAQFNAGDWEFSVGGSGSNGPDFNGTSFGGSAAYMVTKQLRVGVNVAANVLDLGVVGTRYQFNSSTLQSTGVIANRSTISDTQTAMSATRTLARLGRSPPALLKNTGSPPPS